MKGRKEGRPQGPREICNRPVDLLDFILIQPRVNTFRTNLNMGIFPVVFLAVRGWVQTANSLLAPDHFYDALCQSGSVYPLDYEWMMEAARPL